MPTYANLLYPPWKRLLQQLRQDAVALAQHQYTFQGRYEPVLWLFDGPCQRTHRPGLGGYHWTKSLCPAGERYITTYHHFTDDVLLDRQGDTSMHMRYIGRGLVNFCDSVVFRQIEEALGAEVVQRIPQERAFQWCPKRRYVLADLVPWVYDDTSWEELLFLTAVRYAKYGLIYISAHPVAPTLLQRAAAHNKRVYHLPLAAFRPQQYRALQHCPGIAGPLWFTPTTQMDVNAPAFQEELTHRCERFGAFWPFQ